MSRSPWRRGGQDGAAKTGGSALACTSVATGQAGLSRINTTVAGTERAELWANSPSTLARSFIHRNSGTDSWASNTQHAKIGARSRRAHCAVGLGGKNKIDGEKEKVLTGCINSNFKLISIFLKGVKTVFLQDCF